MITRLNVDVVVVGVLFIAAALYSRYRKKDKGYLLIGMYLGTSLISGLYLVFLCAKAGPGYIGRSDALCPLLFGRSYGCPRPWPMP